jgi:hypothetical protein
LNTTEAGDALKLFNEKAERLLSLSYWNKSLGAGAVVEWKRGEGWDSVFVGADEESLEALLLTARLFMQNNERISLGNVRRLYQTIPVDMALQDSVRAHCDELNAFLDSDSNLVIEEHRQLTHRDILEIFLYGGYAHTNAAKRRIFDGIRSTAFFPVFQADVVTALVRLARAIRSIQAINGEAISQLPRFSG